MIRRKLRAAPLRKIMKYKIRDIIKHNDASTDCDYYITDIINNEYVYYIIYDILFSTKRSCHYFSLEAATSLYTNFFRINDEI